MKIIKLSVIIFTSAITIACGGSDGGGGGNSSSSEIKDGENIFTTTESANAALKSTTEITEKQNVVFELSDDTLILTTDLKINGNLTIK